MLPLQYWFDSILKQVTFNNIVSVFNPSGVLIATVCFPVASTKHCAWQDRCIASTHRCQTGCIPSTTTLYHFRHVRWSNAKKYGIILSTAQRWSGQFASLSARMKAIMMKTGFIRFWTHRRVVMLLNKHIHTDCKSVELLIICQNSNVLSAFLH